MATGFTTPFDTSADEAVDGTTTLTGSEILASLMLRGRFSNKVLQ
jgi:hypothetical protein